MTTKTITQKQGIAREEARELLKLTVWQLDLAAETGLLDQHQDGTFSADSVGAAQHNLKQFRRALQLEYRVTADAAARLLSISLKEFRRLAQQDRVTVVGETRGKHGKTLHYRTGDVYALGEAVTAPAKANSRAASRTNLAEIAAEYQLSVDAVTDIARQISARVDRDTDGTRSIARSREAALRLKLECRDVQPETGERALSVEAALVAERVGVNLRDRKNRPVSVTLHLGPTNSGKTFDALNRLAAAGRGVYAAPLRMLAREAYLKMVAKIGEANVGLITGEEQINPDAPVICCTAEMAPSSGETLVIDEAHWAADEDRGYAWTRLLLGGAYDTIEVAANRGAEKFLTAVLGDADYLNIEYHDRLSPLTFGGEVKIGDIPAGSLLVVFSRKAVHALAKRLIAAGRKVGVLYGALPPETRAEQIAKFMDGDIDILVCTDVIGHGINSPASAVIIGQTDKFDGKKIRDLLTWELAQVAGRAGRYGHAGAGQVFALAGEPGFAPKKDLIAHGAAAAAGHCSDGLVIERGLLRPTFTDLGAPDAHQLGVALTSWAAVAADVLSTRDGVEAVPVTPLWERWEAIGDMLGARLTPTGFTTAWTLPGETAWQVVTTPIDLESAVLPAMVDSLAAGADRFGPVLESIRIGVTGTLDTAETAAGNARDLMVVARIFPQLRDGLWEEASLLERLASKTISKKLASTLKASKFGVCEECGRGCAPHFSRCDRCHHGKSAGPPRSSDVPAPRRDRGLSTPRGRAPKRGAVT